MVVELKVMCAANRDNAVWPQVALEQLDSLYGYALTLTRNRQEAEDLVQETYVRAIASHHRLAENSNIKGWMFAILRNTWLSQRKRIKMGPQFVHIRDDVEDRWLADSSNDPLDACIRLWEGREVRAAFLRLPNDSREVLILRDVEGFSYREISEILGFPMGTIMSRLSRARVKLKHLLKTQDSSATKIKIRCE